MRFPAKRSQRAEGVPVRESGCLVSGRLAGPFLAQCPDGTPGCDAERSFHRLRSIILALALTIASAAPLYAPPLSFSHLRLANQVAFAWARRYRVDIALAREIIRAADRHGLDRDVAFRLVARESGFRVNALGDAGEIGLTQIKPTTAQDLRPGITIGQLYRPDINLNLGFGYMAQLRTRYRGDMWRAAAAYNSGMTVADTLPGSTEYAIELLGTTGPGARRQAGAIAP
jgi:soluble lytic murein transglycosylase-like protein